MDLLGSLAIESVFPILYAYQIRRKLTVVSNFLVSMHNNRIALGGVDSNRVYCDRPGLNAIGFNNGHVVAVDGEDEVRVLNSLGASQFWWVGLSWVEFCCASISIRSDDLIAAA